VATGTKELLTMISTAIRTPLSGLSILGLALGVLFGADATNSAHASGLDPRGAGTYAVDVTLRDCATGAPAGAPFASLVTLHGDGSITETPGGRAFAPGQRQPGHGSWHRTGFRTVSQEMIALILFDTPANLPGTPGFDPAKPVTPGFQAGWQTVSHTITFSDPTHATSSGTNAFFTLAGVPYRTGCSTAVLERILN